MLRELAGRRGVSSRPAAGPRPGSGAEVLRGASSIASAAPAGGNGPLMTDFRAPTHLFYTSESALPRTGKGLRIAVGSPADY